MSSRYELSKMAHAHLYKDCAVQVVEHKPSS